MRRTLATLAAIAIALAACTPAVTTGASPAPQKTGDFKQSKLDIAYSFVSDASVHNPTSKQLLTAALDAMKKEAKSSGGSDEVATPDFTADTDTNLADFKKFLFRGNVVDLAVAVIIGTAFGSTSADTPLARQSETKWPIRP